MKKCIRLHPADNVAMLLSAAQAAELCCITDASGTELGSVRIEEEVPMFHKIALADIPDGSHVIKLNTVIGVASGDIAKGRHVHVHNVLSIEGRKGAQQ